MSDFPSCTTGAAPGAEPHPHNFQLQQGFFALSLFDWPGQPRGGPASASSGQMPGQGGQWMSPGWLPYMGPNMGPDPQAQFGPQQVPHPFNRFPPVTAMLYCTQCGLSYVFGPDGRWHKVEIGDPLHPEQPE